MLEPQIVEKPPLTIVGLETPFRHGLSPDTNAPQVLGALWDAFCHRTNEVPHRVGQASYGLIYGRPEKERSHPDELQYIAGVAVDRVGELPVGMTSRTVPGGTFAVFLHHGPIHKISATCNEIYRVWLPASAWRHAEIADVELYDERFDCESEASELEYWISVVPRESAR
jgi:AraC family transcriptional regulator